MKARAETRNPAAGACMRPCVPARAVWNIRGRPARSGAEGPAPPSKSNNVREACVPGWAQGDLWVGAQDRGGGKQAAEGAGVPESARRRQWGRWLAARQPGLLLSLSPHHLHLDCAQCVTPRPAPSSFLAIGLRQGGVGLSPRQMVGGGVGTREEGKDGSVEGQGQQLLSRCLSSVSPERLSRQTCAAEGQPVFRQAPRRGSWYGQRAPLLPPRPGSCHLLADRCWGWGVPLRLLVFSASCCPPPPSWPLEVVVMGC